MFDKKHRLDDEGVLVKMGGMLISMLLDTAKISPSLLRKDDTANWNWEVSTRTLTYADVC